MFDANARYLKKGTLFFARKQDDLLYCEMLDDEHRNPRIKILTSYINNNGYKGHIYKDHNLNWGFSTFAGYVKDDSLCSFISEGDRSKAAEILMKVEAFKLAQENGDLAEILLPLEKS